jgi:hypothetical protein
MTGKSESSLVLKPVSSLDDETAGVELDLGAALEVGLSPESPSKLSSNAEHRHPLSSRMVITRPVTKP